VNFPRANQLLLQWLVWGELILNTEEFRYCIDADLGRYSARVENPAPLDYVSPKFPSLYWPVRAEPGEPQYLYYTDDIMLFTLYWTLILYAVFHLSAAGYAIIMQVGKGKSVWKYAWAIIGVYVIVAGAEAVMAGCFVGLM
jgi:hypothetical protein